MRELTAILGVRTGPEPQKEGSGGGGVGGARAQRVPRQSGRGGRVALAAGAPGEIQRWRQQGQTNPGLTPT